MTGLSSRSQTQEFDMSDRELIQRIIALYAMLADDQRIEDWSNLFTVDAEFIVHHGAYENPREMPVVLKGRSEILARGRDDVRLCRAQGSRVIHLGSPPLIDIEGDTANAGGTLSSLISGRWRPRGCESRRRSVGYGLDQLAQRCDEHGLVEFRSLSAISAMRLMSAR
jgi:SnoaL-like protein